MPAREGQHLNQTAWVPHKHQKKKRQDILEKIAGFTDNCCPRCIQQLEWRKKYGKYKPIDRPGKCHACLGRHVVRAYHSLCEPCAKEKGVCAKCEKEIHLLHDPQRLEEMAEEQREKELREKIADLPLRFKISAERRLQRGEALEDVEEVVRRGQRQAAHREASRYGASVCPGPAAAAGSDVCGASDSDSDQVIDSDED
eukprot:TRINITY_DN43504_c0_g1_i1.p1 TRINITY_DN43504_c0_g1~~TRINITY_DN43504_c0_g1_i1.p1  ORF type:complete len:225 (+),score=99.05 TRINITY_DN43504_c0_g1_i1:81-677(+)